MNKKLSGLILLIFGLLALFAYGCSHSSGGFLANPMENKDIVSREAVIDGLGRLPTLTFPTGAKIEGLEENTLPSGTTVVVTEETIASSSRHKGYFSDYTPIYKCIYKITAFQNESNLTGTKNYVTTLEKPFKVTFPKSQLSQGAILLGIKESDSDPWRYLNISDSNDFIANMAGIRLSQSSAAEYSFELYRLGVQFALMTFGEKGESEMPETYVSSLTASTTSSIIVKNGKYSEDLKVKCILKGQMLDSIKPTDFRIRITYHSNQSDEAPIKVNGTNITQNNKADKTIPGSAYVHSFVVDSVTGYNLNGTSGDFSFTLNLKGVETKSFPNSFLIEVFNLIESEKILPYIYTEFCSVDMVERINHVGEYAIEYELDGGIVTPANPTGYNAASETFVLNEPTKEGYTFIGWTGFNGDTPQKNLAIIQGSDSDMSYFANYTPISYSITYQLEGGNLAKKNPLSYDITSSTIILNNPTKDNFRFVGWTGSNGDTPQMTLIIETGSTGNRTYVANFTEASYVITYNLDGGAVTPLNPTGYNTASETFTLTNPTKAGYEFIGWGGTGLTGNNNLKVSIEQGSTEDKEFTAYYSPIVYSIKYQLDGGQTAITNPSVYDVTSSTIVLNNPTKEGYVFTGWTSSEITTPRLNTVIEKGSYGNKTFTANWSLNSFKLTLKKGTGVAQVTGEGQYKYGASVIATCTMLDGYEFDFWAGNIEEGTFTMPANDVVMQANAKLINYSIECNLDGGSVVVSNPTSFTLISPSITLVNPTKKGYDFIGWTGSNIDVPQMDVTIDSGSTGNRSYTASYSLLTYGISYYLDGGAVNSDNPVNYNVNSNDIVLNNPTKDGFRFVGWTGSNGNEPQPAMTIESGSTGEKEFYANYVQAENTINYNLNGGTNHPNNPHGFNYASDTFVLYPPTKNGYSFIGWTGYNGDVPQMTVTVEHGSIGDRTYIANYEEVAFSITYHLGGGTNSLENRTGYAVNTETFTIHEPTRPGYAFVGWTEGAATFPQMLVTIPQGSTDDKVFTAHWVECITFTLPGGVPLVMHKCPEGTFLMGSPEGEQGREDFVGRESPQHSVTLTKPFYICKYEITQEQYIAVMGVASNPSNFKDTADYASRPVEQVNWNNAKAFCASLTNYLTLSIPNGYSGFDLPTEAQWEYACRAGTTTSLNNGTNLTQTNGNCPNLNAVGWYSNISNGETHPVGLKQPNAWGLYDMLGNVHEWCLDYYKETYYQDCGDCTDPTGPDTGSDVVLKGGRFNGFSALCRPAFRSNGPKGRVYLGIGFRPVLLKN